MNHGEAVFVSTLPQCDVCKRAGETTEAAYDARTVYGPWAYLCAPHWNTHAAEHRLGTGVGQRLLLRAS